MNKIKEVFQPADVILVTCRSGGRSAKAVNQLAEAGFKNVYNITDGFEGDKVEDTKQRVFGSAYVKRLEEFRLAIYLRDRSKSDLI